MQVLLDIFDVCAEFGVKLNSHNKAKCPLPGHNEKTASFKVYPKNNNFYCFGCGANGDAIQLKADLTGRTNNEIYKEVMCGLDTSDKETKRYLEELAVAREKQKAVDEFENWIHEAKIDLYTMCHLMKDKIEEIDTKVDGVPNDIPDELWEYIGELSKFEMMLESLEISRIEFYKEYKDVIEIARENWIR